MPTIKKESRKIREKSYANYNWQYRQRRVKNVDIINAKIIDKFRILRTSKLRAAAAAAQVESNLVGVPYLIFIMRRVTLRFSGLFLTDKIMQAIVRAACNLRINN